VTKGGLLTVENGGSDSGTTLRGGENIFGLDDGANILSGGSAVVSVGGVADDVSIGRGGDETVDAGGIAKNVTIAGGTLSIANGAVTDATAVTFSGASGGVLLLAAAADFSGTVAGLTKKDKIDLGDIQFASVQHPTYAGTSSGGTLTVTDGTHTANIALLGNYLSSIFVAKNDGHGGTIITDPQLVALHLAQPHTPSLSSAGDHSR